MLALTAGMIISVNLIGDNTPEAIAQLSAEEGEICLIINTNVDTGWVDVGGLIECIATLNND